MAEEAIFSFVLETLRDLVIQEARLLGGVEDQVDRLQQKLNHMRWFLRDSAANQPNQKRVIEWVLEVRDIAYEAENVIETYAIKVASRGRRGTVGQIKRFAGVLNECYHRHQIGSDVETLLNKISDLTTSFKEYGISQIMENDGASSRSELRRTYSMVNDEDEVFLGSDDSINMLAEKLVSDQYRTVTLYGMGGLGKTTLARKVYHHPVVTKHFDDFAWVSISQQWHKVDIWRGILIKLMPDHKRDDILKWREDELVRELSQFLRTSKCLLVLDDIWSIGAWDSIKPAIPINENGSKVLLTTRKMEVGTLADASGYKHEPKILTTDESWELLCNKALRGQDSKETAKKKNIGKEMIGKCGGLPFAVVALGAILSSKSSDEEWRIVGDNVKSYLQNARDEINVKAILALSYDDLPYQLKPCFLYLSKYAEDAEIAVVPLYQYWMAEGMVSSEDRIGIDESIMDVAERYLNKLAERGMVSVQKEEEYPFTRFKSCRLHDLMRDFCISKAKEEKFFQSIDYGNIHDVGEEASSLSTRTICRLSISLDKANDAKRFFPDKDVKRSLRSFILKSQDIGAGDSKIKFKFGEFVMLRVLVIVGIGAQDREVCSMVYHTSSIGKLVHLRYLTLWETRFSVISSSISKLKQLQTLDLCRQKVVWKPNVIWKLPRLKHLYLPHDMKDQSHFTMKLGFDGMSQLEILEGFHNKVCNVNHLSKLTNLRKLEATVENKLEDLEKLINHVRKLTHLRFLSLTILISDLSSENGAAIINDILSYSNLVSLLICGKLSKIPDHDSCLCPNLRHLRLESCEIEEDPFRTLERLPNLRNLILIGNSVDGKEMSYHASGFPQLRSLTLLAPPNLEKWEIEDGAMPNLFQLQIYGCRKLEMIPAGLRSNTLLKKLNLEHMPSELCERVRVNEDGKEGLDFDKVRHIQTIKIG